MLPCERGFGGGQASTKASVAWDPEHHAFHLYEELLDGRLWLELEVTELKAGFLEKDRVIRLCFPVPKPLLKKVFLPKYRRPPGDGGLFFFDLKTGNTEKAKNAADVDRILSKMGRKKRGSAHGQRASANSTVFEPSAGTTRRRRKAPRVNP